MAIHIDPAHKGRLHSKLGVAEGKPIPAKKLAKAEHSANPALKKEAVFAENAKKWKHPAAKAEDALKQQPARVEPIKTDRGKFGFRNQK